MMCPGGHQCSQNGWFVSETSTVLKPRARSPSARKTCSSFRRSMSNASEPFEPLISHWNALRRPSARRVASIVPTEPFSNSTAASIASSTVRPSTNVFAKPETVAISPFRNRAEVDDVRAEVAERAGAGLVGIEAPRVERRVVAPVLQVAAAEVADLPQLARVDHLAREPHRRDEAVVERAQVLDAGRGDRLPDLVALVGVAAERLLADDVLARLRGGDRRLGVQRVRAAVVEEPDPVVLDELAPVAGRVLVAVALRRLLDRLRRSARRCRRASARAAAAT